MPSSLRLRMVHAEDYERGGPFVALEFVSWLSGDARKEERTPPEDATNSFLPFGSSKPSSSGAAVLF